MTDRRSDEIEELFAEVDSSIASTEAVIGAFRREMERTSRSTEDASRRVSGFDRSIGKGLRGAFDEIVFEGGRASDALKAMARSMSSSVLNQALTPVQNALGAGIGGLVRSGLGAITGGVVPFADGAGFAGGRVRAFADGGIVAGPTTFPMRGGQTGLMGEAGPEAIMPLSRGPDGSLGVKAQGNATTVVNINITTPDVEGFRRSRSQIAAEMSRAMRAGQRNL
ncbi:hypothetical protein FHS89_002571 [Rubricella aquisinus]|uniref:Phage tail tape measure protein n=1 Tax=Rubricella aquisinus TaxID=2028108 RepID=A0A840WZG5_9RHOB|nr:phage tail tape measure protein [Rubricella aquisinus]MBB5516540.1 hypothetical protein [Rubricella aquisinus]